MRYGNIIGGAMQCTFDTISRWHGIDHTYVDFSYIHFKFTFFECVCLCVMAIIDYLTKKKKHFALTTDNLASIFHIEVFNDAFIVESRSKICFHKFFGSY